MIAYYVGVSSAWLIGGTALGLAFGEAARRLHRALQRSDRGRP